MTVVARQLQQSCKDAEMADEIIEPVEPVEPVESVEPVEPAEPVVDHTDRRASLAAALRSAREPAEPAEPVKVEPEKPARTPPSSWRKELAASYATLPDEVVAEIERRESDYFKGLEPYKQSAKEWQDFQAVLSPYEAALKASGKQPRELVSNLLTSHSALTFGSPEQKAQAFAQLAASYGVTLNGAPQSNPMHNELAQIKSEIDEFKSAQSQADEARAMADIAAFAKDKPHFEAVRSDMAAWLQSNPSLTLDAAYERATWANPEVRTQMLQAQQQQADAERIAKAKEEARKARSASASINGAPVNSGSMTVDPNNRRAVLAEAMRLATNH